MPCKLVCHMLKPHHAATYSTQRALNDTDTSSAPSVFNSTDPEIFYTQNITLCITALNFFKKPFNTCTHWPSEGFDVSNQLWILLKDGNNFGWCHWQFILVSMGTWTEPCLCDQRSGYVHHFNHTAVNASSMVSTASQWGVFQGIVTHSL